MTTAYKYLDLEGHATNLVQFGAVKIGTLYGYAAAELGARSDSREGTHRAVWEQEHPIVEPVRQIRIVGNTLAHTDYSQDAYVYCASLELSRDAAGGLNFCVKIGDFDAFASELHVRVERYHGSELRRFVRPVSYSTRDGSSRPAANDLPFIKDAATFAFEREIRAVYYDPSPSPNHRLTAPGVINVPAITLWVSLLAPGRTGGY